MNEQETTYPAHFVKKRNSVCDTPSRTGLNTVLQSNEFINILLEIYSKPVNRHSRQRLPITESSRGLEHSLSILHYNSPCL
jgi:hypothetical protein